MIIYVFRVLEDKPLEDMQERIENLNQTDGAKFFDEAQQSVFPQRDFELCTMVGGMPLRSAVDPGCTVRYELHGAC